MTSLEGLLLRGGQDALFACEFIGAAHQGRKEAADGCWKRQVREMLNHARDVDVIPLSKREQWAEEKAQWVLWPIAELGGCGAPYSGPNPSC
ncbi:hypothetical protein ACWGB8_21010 [Kitasatospora sp. NPDC054939]